ncbi:MAG: PfaD family polyunsaturated fatty acid/polyketide biosynthesis protein [Mariprofundaceae bacterium]|nr:PfaD family polyunsaturated fatty acid/polyketide biosynthesis protein [Mariprofundaceae bacterium]
MTSEPFTPMPSGLFSPIGKAISLDTPACLSLLRNIDYPLFFFRDEKGWMVQAGEHNPNTNNEGLRPWLSVLPACPLTQLGSASFCVDLRLRYAYVGGSMAKGISSVALVRALGEAGMLGFFGAAGLAIDDVDAAIVALQSNADFSFGCNLIHSPSEPQLEEALVNLYLYRSVTLIEASAFLDLTLALVRYRTHGIYRNEKGEIITPNRIIAKVSREEIATKFFSPPPERMLECLVDQGVLTAKQAKLAVHIPMAQDVTAEADSGGHTDNRPALTLFPTLLALKENMQQRYAYHQRLRLGLGGGIATPTAAAAAFAMGAAYVVTGTVNQACIESGSSHVVRKILAETRQADIAMAPSGDMFEMGVHVQVVKRGTMFPMRAARLYALYCKYDSLASIPINEREKLEKTWFRMPLEDVWQQTKVYFSKRDPKQLSRAKKDEKHRMALVFRWYLGQSPVWANTGDTSRVMDYQIWCGPAMGAFNEWVKGSCIEPVSERQVVVVALNILWGAAMQLRQQCWRGQGLRPRLPRDAFAPIPLQQIKELVS